MKKTLLKALKEVQQDSNQNLVAIYKNGLSSHGMIDKVLFTVEHNKSQFKPHADVLAVVKDGDITRIYLEL